MNRHRRLGFTITESLVVIAMIAILAAILFPVFVQVREKARQSTCISNFKQIGLAVLRYNQDFDEYYPPCEFRRAVVGRSPSALCNVIPRHRHQGTADILYLDGHVESMHKKDWYNPDFAQPGLNCEKFWNTCPKGRTKWLIQENGFTSRNVNCLSRARIRMLRGWRHVGLQTPGEAHKGPGRRPDSRDQG